MQAALRRWMGLAMWALGGCAAALHEQDGSLGSEIAEIMVGHRAYDQAVPLLQRSLASDPNNGRLHALWALVLRQRGLYHEAEREFKLAQTLQPSDVDAVAGLGVLYDLMGRADSESWHQRAIAMQPARAELYNNLGFSYYIHHRDEQAIAAFKQALERDPSAARTYNNLAFALARQGHIDDSLAAFEQVNSKAGALANLALAFELQGDRQQAVHYYQQALKLDKNLIKAQQNLAKLADNQERP